MGMIVGLVIAGAFVLLLLIVMGMYNTLVRRRIDTDNAWSQIDVQLKRRYDLIPNLVETVKGYAGHEKGTLEAVIQARNQAVSLSGGGGGGAASVAQRAEAENALSATLGRLFALSEAYPDLKANQSFQQLQSELSDLENKIAASRRFFNNTAAEYNATRESFPAVLFAQSMGFSTQEFFNLDEAERKAVTAAPQVKF